MRSGFKMYMALIFLLIGAQIVVAGENMVDFQRALRDYQQERNPSQTETEVEVETKFKNPEIEVNLGKDKKEKEKKD